MSGADRLTFRQAEKSKSAIQTTKIIQRLQAHIFGELELSQTQVTAAQTLLRKTLPDQKATDLSSMGEPITVILNTDGRPPADD